MARDREIKRRVHWTFGVDRTQRVAKRDEDVAVTPHPRPSRPHSEGTSGPKTVGETEIHDEGDEKRGESQFGIPLGNLFGPRAPAVNGTQQDKAIPIS